MEASQLYPMVRGRLTRINGEAVREAVTKEAQDDNALNRELNLTWTTQLQADNGIVAGRWWREGDAGRPLVSVEEKLAERLGIGLGDELGFSCRRRNLHGRGHQHPQRAVGFVPPQLLHGCSRPAYSRVSPPPG